MTDSKVLERSKKVEALARDIANRVSDTYKTNVELVEIGAKQDTIKGWVRSIAAAHPFLDVQIWADDMELAAIPSQWLSNSSGMLSSKGIMSALKAFLMAIKKPGWKSTHVVKETEQGVPYVVGETKRKLELSVSPSAIPFRYQDNDVTDKDKTHDHGKSIVWMSETGVDVLSLSSLSAPQRKLFRQIERARHFHDVLATIYARIAEMLTTLELASMQLTAHNAYKQRLTQTPVALFNTMFLASMKAVQTRLFDLQHNPTTPLTHVQRQQQKVEYMKSLFPPTQPQSRIETMVLSSLNDWPDRPMEEQPILLLYDGPVVDLIRAYRHSLHTFVLDSSVRLARYESFAQLRARVGTRAALLQSQPTAAGRLQAGPNPLALFSQSVQHVGHSDACIAELFQYMANYCHELTHIVDATFPVKPGGSYWHPSQLFELNSGPDDAQLTFKNGTARSVFAQQQPVLAWKFPWRNLRELQIPGPLSGALLTQLRVNAPLLECLCVTDAGAPPHVENADMAEQEWNGDEMAEFLVATADRLKHLSLSLWTDGTPATLRRVRSVTQQLPRLSKLERLEVTVRAYEGRREDIGVDVYSLFGEGDSLTRDFMQFAYAKPARLRFVHLTWPVNSEERRRMLNVLVSFCPRLCQIVTVDRVLLDPETVANDVYDAVQYANTRDAKRGTTGPRVQVFISTPYERLFQWPSWSIATLPKRLLKANMDFFRLNKQAPTRGVHKHAGFEEDEDDDKDEDDFALELEEKESRRIAPALSEVKAQLVDQAHELELKTAILADATHSRSNGAIGGAAPFIAFAQKSDTSSGARQSQHTKAAHKAKGGGGGKKKSKFQRGVLHSGSSRGPVVEDPKQAEAIGIHAAEEKRAKHQSKIHG